jgi:hypothetical protein
MTNENKDSKRGLAYADKETEERVACAGEEADCLFGQNGLYIMSYHIICHVLSTRSFPYVRDRLTNILSKMSQMLDEYVICIMALLFQLIHYGQ